MATKIKLMRLGKMREPHYRIVVADARTKRDGRAIETIGEYHPKSDPSVIKVDAERAAYWLGVGAQPTEAVAAILKVTGDWQKFRGEPAPAPMKIAPPRADKLALFNAALAEVSGEPEGEATTPRKRAAKVAKPVAEAKPDAPATAEARPDAPATAEAKPDAPATAEAKPDTPATADAKPDAPATADAKPDAPATADAKPDAAPTAEAKAEDPSSAEAGATQASAQQPASDKPAES